jgi:glycosyltransferase involved in cell wall biosynthesis
MFDEKSAPGEKPLISVIIPTYNRMPYLKEAVESAIQQTYSNLEIIVVDDGSTDSTSVYLEEIFEKRLSVIAVTNGGVSKARNLGINAARGEYVAFLDSDDVWNPTKIEKQVELFCGSTILVYCGSLIKTASEMRIDEPVFRGECHQAFLRNPGVAIVKYGCSSAVVKKDAIIQIGGFDEAVPAPSEDYDFFWRLSRLGTFDFINEPLVTYRIHDGNVSGDSRTYHAGCVFVVNKALTEIKLDFLAQRIFGFKLFTMLFKTHLREKDIRFMVKTIVETLRFFFVGRSSR